MPIVWDVLNLEPFASELVEHEIQDYIDDQDLKKQFQWTKETYFAGLYQKVRAVRIQNLDDD